jgi:hypothetical protein
MSAIHDLISTPAPENIQTSRSLLDRARRERLSYFPSPGDWQDQVLYFLLPDRFNDGKSDTRPLLTRSEIVALRSQAARPEWNWHNWAESGKRWQGGTLRGIEQQLDYLEGLGITAHVYHTRHHRESCRGLLGVRALRFSPDGLPE